MKLEYDSQVDAAYIKLSKAEVTGSEEIRPGIVVDYDAQDRVIGIEILHVRKERPDINLGHFAGRRIEGGRAPRRHLAACRFDRPVIHRRMTKSGILGQRPGREAATSVSVTMLIARRLKCA